MENKKEHKELFGYIKFDGIQDGVIETRKLKKILDGLDESFNHILKLEFDGNDEIDFNKFDFTIRVKEGSLVIDLIVPVVIGGIMTGAGVFALSYLKKVGEKLAENDVADKTSLEIISGIKEKVFDTFHKILKIEKHLKGEKKKIKTGKFKNDNHDIEIINDENLVEIVSVKELTIYKKIPNKVFSKIISEVDKNNNLDIVKILPNNKKDIVRITEKEKGYFDIIDDNDEDIILPELKHNDEVELEGKITKINETWKTLGFEYKGYILVLKPFKKTLLPYKEKIIANGDKILTRAMIKGVVTRLGTDGKISEKKPKIIFSEIEKIDELEDQELENKLFEI